MGSSKAREAYAAPAFHRRRIERYAGQIVDLSAILCSEWKPGQQLDIAAEMMRLAFQVTARTLFDTEVTPEIHVINEQVNVIMDLYNLLVALPRAELLLNAPLPPVELFEAFFGGAHDRANDFAEPCSSCMRTRYGSLSSTGNFANGFPGRVAPAAASRTPGSPPAEFRPGWDAC